MSTRARIRVDTSKGALRRLRRDVNQLKSNIDIKFFDSTIDDAVVSATGTVQGQIFTIPDGNDQSEKDGLKITIKSVSIRWQLSLPSTVTVADATDICRFILLKDSQTNGALPSVTDILANADIQDQKNLDNSKRFTTLLDRTISINSMGGFGAILRSLCFP